jgi:hypothetical protein
MAKVPDGSGDRGCLRQEWLVPRREFKLAIAM